MAEGFEAFEGYQAKGYQAKGYQAKRFESRYQQCTKFESRVLNKLPCLRFMAKGYQVYLFNPYKVPVLLQSKSRWHTPC